MYKFINESKRAFSVDYLLLAILCVTAIVSIIAIYLAIPLNNAADSMGPIIRQSGWFVICVVAVVILLKFGIDRIFTGVYIAYWILLGMLVVLMLARYEIINVFFINPVNGAYAWYQIPYAGSFQPSEFMKLVLVIISANIIYKHNQEKKGPSFISDVKLAAKMISYAILPLILIILQPDSGIPIIMLIGMAIMFLLSGVRREWIIITAGLSIGLLLLIVYLFYNNQPLLNSLLGGSSTNYRLNRFYGWLEYQEWPDSHGYQLYRAIMSYGTAGLFGHPLMSVIASYPESQTDFIFAVIAQNFGFIGSSMVVLLTFALDLKLLSIIINSTLERERYMMMGSLAMIVFQHFQNMGMILGILPITGITLPFISYGGSSLLSYTIPIAVALYMYSETKNAHRH